MSSFLQQTQSFQSSFDADVKSAEEQLTRQKTSAVNQADGRILRRLAIVIVSACLIFGLLWIRERSDESWVEFLSTEEGVEAVLVRLSANSNIMTRKPPGFSLSEFTKIVGKKDIPSLLSLVTGATLDVKRLGQVSSLILDQLKKKNVISERMTSGLQTWFELCVEKEGSPNESNTAAESTTS